MVSGPSKNSPDRQLLLVIGVPPPSDTIFRWGRTASVASEGYLTGFSNELINETRESNVALRFKGAISGCDF